MSNSLQNTIFASAITLVTCRSRASMCLALPLFRFFSSTLTPYEEKIIHYYQHFIINNDHKPEELCRNQYIEDLFSTFGVLTISHNLSATMLSMFTDRTTYLECLHLAGEFHKHLD